MGCLKDLFEYMIKVVLDFGIAKAQDAHSMFFQVVQPREIVLHLNEVVMNTAIGFNFKSVLDTEHVKDIRPERVLSSEFQSGEMATAQSGPKNFLGRSGVATLLPCHVDSFGGGFAAGFAWHTSPLAPLLFQIRE